MSTEENKAIVRRSVDAWNKRDLDALFELQDKEKFVWHGPGGEQIGPREEAQARENLEKLFAAFPDIRSEIADLIAEGDKVAVRLVVRGGPPTGRNTHIMRIEDGKIVESWDCYGRPA